MSLYEKADSWLLLTNILGHSAEKDGILSDEKQTIQTSLFTLLKDLLKSPTQEELHSVLAYIVSVREEQQVCFIGLLQACSLCYRLTFSAFQNISALKSFDFGCAFFLFFFSCNY